MTSTELAAMRFEVVASDGTSKFFADEYEATRWARRVAGTIRELNPT